MKAVLAIVAVLGLVYALAFFGVLPAQKMADKNPALASVLKTLHLAKSKKPIQGAQTAAAPTPEQAALAEGQKKLAADQAQLAKDRAAFEAEQQQAAAPSPTTNPNTPGAPAASENSAKLSAIYATMSADDISHILGKLPDPDVIGTLTQLDEKKAGQVLALLPVDRAARLSRLMTHPAPQLQAAL